MIFDVLKSYYDNYNKCVDELEKFIDYYDVLKNCNDDEIKKDTLAHRKFFNNSIIITLYGDFERTIKLFAEEYLNKKNFLLKDNFSELKSISILNVREAIKCIEEPSTYRKDKTYSDVLGETLAMSLNSGNIFPIYPEILLNNFMNALSNNISKLIVDKLGIKDYELLIKNNPRIISYYKDFYKLSEEEIQQRMRNIQDFFKDIDLMVDSRHQIAHTGAQSILNDIDDIKNKYILLLKAFIGAYYDILRFDLLKICYENKREFLCEMIPRENNFESKKILTFNCNCSSLDKDSLLLIKTNSGFSYVKINEIQIDDKQVFEAHKNDHIGIKMSKAIKSSYNIFVLDYNNL